MKYFPVIREIVITLLIASVLFLGIHYILQNSEVISGSMLPTLSIGERLFVNKVAYKFGRLPQRGDIIVFVPPSAASSNSDTDYIKRIIGMPGETIEIKDGVAYIHKTDGSVMTLEEPFLTGPPGENYVSPIIQPDNYFVMGGNREFSSDSRTGWTVPSINIVGKAWWVTWPFNKFGTAPNYKFLN